MSPNFDFVRVTQGELEVLPKTLEKRLSKAAQVCLIYPKIISMNKCIESELFENLFRLGIFKLSSLVQVSLECKFENEYQFYRYNGLDSGTMCFFSKLEGVKFKHIFSIFIPINQKCFFFLFNERTGRLHGSSWHLSQRMI
jgi:hypothetical protein